MIKRALFAAPLLLLPAASTLPIQPGKWQSTVTITDMQMPNAPAGMAAAMRGHPTTVTACVTPQQAADGPRAVLQASNGRCRYTSFNAMGGRFDAVLQCSFASGSMTTTSHGTYSATTLDVAGTAVMSGRRSMTTRTHTVARRVGGC